MINKSRNERVERGHSLMNKEADTTNACSTAPYRKQRPPVIINLTLFTLIRSNPWYNGVITSTL